MRAVFGVLARRMARLAAAARFALSLNAAGRRVPHARGRFPFVRCVTTKSARCESAGSTFKPFIAKRLPAANQVPFLLASGRLAAGRKMHMEMSCPFLKRAFLIFMTLKPLAQIPRLTDVKRNPFAGFIFPGQNEIARHWLERSAHGINPVCIFLAGRAGPIERRRTVGFMEAT